MTEAADENLVARRSLLAQLFAAQSGRKLDDETAGAYLLALRRMDTPRLARVVERILGDIETDASPYRAPSVSRIWEVAREMRKLPNTSAPAPTLELHGTPEVRHDPWETAGNTLLLNYITQGLVQRSIHGQKAARDAGRYAGAARTQIVVKWKQIWARDMREDRELYDCKLDGKKAWADAMACAERELDALIASERVAA